MSESCGTCKFIDRSAGGHLDRSTNEAMYPCRRYPPKASSWSYVKLDEWCGEHKGEC